MVLPPKPGIKQILAKDEQDSPPGNKAGKLYKNGVGPNFRSENLKQI